MHPHELPAETIERIFSRLGFEFVNAFEKECCTRYFDPDPYTIPQSEWYDGPGEGAIIWNKRGQRAKLLHPEF